MHFVSDCFFSKTQAEHKITITLVYYLKYRVAVKANINNSNNNSKKIGEEKRKEEKQNYEKKEF